MTSKIINYLRLDDKDKKNHSPLFFQPFKNVKDISYRATSIATAPVALSILTAEMLLYAGISSANAFAKLVNGDNDAAKFKLKSAGKFILGSMIFAVAALASPFINIIDFAGALIKSLSCSKELTHQNHTCKL